MVDMRYVSPYLTPSAYWQATRPFDQMLVTATGNGFGADTIFERIDLGNGKVQFKSRGEYLWIGSEGNRGLYIGGDQPNGSWSTFSEIWHPDDRISLLGDRNEFVCAESGGGDRVVVDRRQIGAWEMFFYAVPPADLVRALFPGTVKQKSSAGRDEVITRSETLKAEHFRRPDRPVGSDRIRADRPFDKLQ
jgi:hypothetical protein